MTHEEMATELRKAGWRIQEPLTQENCPHIHMRSSGSCSQDGSGHSEGHCPDCGYHYRYDTPADPKKSTPEYWLSIQPHN